MAGKDPAQAEKEGFIEAIKSGDYKAFKAALELNSELARARDAAGLSVVLLAKYHHREDMLPALIAKAAPLDLFEAAATGESERLVRLLGEERTRIHHFSPDGFQVLHLAAFFGHEALVGLLIDLGAHVHTQARNAIKVHPVNCAAAAGSVRAVRALLEAGADANAVQAGNISVLMSAASRGSEEMTEALLKAGAKLDRRSDDGKTAADYAEERGFPGLAAKLREPE